MTHASVPAPDGYPLQATYYEPFRRRDYELVALINSGGGIPRRFYEPFASWLADQAMPVATYDYRGIGGSRGKSIRGLHASIEDWGSKDCLAMLRSIESRYPRARISIVGHSIGGIVAGFVTPPPLIERFLLVSPHTAYSGDYAGWQKRRMVLQWHIFMPAITRLVGYFPGRRLGFPEDLPYEVAMEWANRRDRMNFGYVRRLWASRNSSDDGSLDLESRDYSLDSRPRRVSNIVTRALVLRPEDDPFATLAAMRRVRSRFPHTTFNDLLLSVSCSTRQSIGHFGFFKPFSREQLWPIALQWLTRQQERMGLVV